MSKRVLKSTPLVAQDLYKPFRSTFVQQISTVSESDRYRGPGYRDVVYTSVIDAPRKCLLYRSERNKPSDLPKQHADLYYDTTISLSEELKAKGNIAPLKSASIRFPVRVDSNPGPGSYEINKTSSIFPSLQTVAKSPSKPHSANQIIDKALNKPKAKHTKRKIYRGRCCGYKKKHMKDVDIKLDENFGGSFIESIPLGISLTSKTAYKDDNWDKVQNELNQNRDT